MAEAAERPDLNAALEHYGSNTQNRRSYMTSCVLHEDNTPSLSVNTEKQLWSCKSCGNGGDVYTLIQLKEGTDFRGAVETATALGLATGSPGGSDSDLSGSAYGGRRRASGKAPARERYRPRYRQ